LRKKSKLNLSVAKVVALIKFYLLLPLKYFYIKIASPTDRDAFFYKVLDYRLAQEGNQRLYIKKIDVRAVHSIFPVSYSLIMRF